MKNQLTFSKKTNIKHGGYFKNRQLHAIPHDIIITKEFEKLSISDQEFLYILPQIINKPLSCLYKEIKNLKNPRSVLNYIYSCYSESFFDRDDDEYYIYMHLPHLAENIVFRKKIYNNIRFLLLVL